MNILVVEGAKNCPMASQLAKELGGLVLPLEHDDKFEVEPSDILLNLAGDNNSYSCLEENCIDLMELVETCAVLGLPQNVESYVDVINTWRTHWHG